MPTPEPSSCAATVQANEWGAALALLPIAATVAFYLLPASWQKHPFIQFAPQLIAYLALALWAIHTRPPLPLLGLHPRGLRSGFWRGLVIGLGLGCLNSVMILKAVPAMGFDITFLKDTPHARIPLAIMLPWLIGCIALFVEVNFRGFLLGRLAVLESHLWHLPLLQRLPPLALITSAVAFSFDPFMVTTFQHLHWIAIWDGLVWGTVRLKTNNLYIPIVAHAVEVIVMYSAVRAALL
ncbi:MAG: CPBP family glutamic-type intramembrane protease [Nitrospira sp.]|nr:CPBP family glutamic-type intramembrane protease [Nitrospira sp.]